MVALGSLVPQPHSKPECQHFRIREFISQRGGKIKKIQEELETTKQDIVDKDKLLSKSLADKENLKKQLDSVKQSLLDKNHMVWDHIVKEIKKLKDYLIMLEDERELANTCLTNVATVQEGLGDKPTQTQNSINYLNSSQKLNYIL